jgi:hypothetical protein
MRSYAAHSAPVMRALAMKAESCDLVSTRPPARMTAFIADCLLLLFV